MNPKLCKRLGLPGVHGHGTKLFRTVSGADNLETSKEAALLLSISDICKSEISHGGMTNLWRDDLTLPSFPYLSDDDEGHANKPKLPARPADSLYSLVSAPMTVAADQFYPANRIRAVSLDQSPKASTVEQQPLSSTDNCSTTAAVVSPMACRSLPTRSRTQQQGHGSRRLSIKVKKEIVRDNRPVSPHHEAPKSKRSKPLQGVPPRSFAGKKISRKKFSWKNYPELEQFLIANRDEYLKHSALNYTVQQKSYNNRLTDRLLELATEHGYIFDETEFNFVIVRDRIRCYYKSFVQSAKKRGVLMGYAARKAGLLTEDELLELGMDDGEIVMPSP